MTTPKHGRYKFLIPARNSRHRIACLALYRAIFRESSHLTLPPDLSAAYSGPRNPIAHLARRAFRRNVADTSPRIVFPALNAGYEALTLIRAARSDLVSSSSTKASPAYDEIVSFLRSRLSERNKSLLAHKLHPPNSRNPPKPSSAPRKGTTPLLVNVTPAPTPQNPRPKPRYEITSRPRPLSELGAGIPTSTSTSTPSKDETGTWNANAEPGEDDDDDDNLTNLKRTARRRVPHIDMAGEFPFLRLTKPQPRLLSRVLRQKILKRDGRFKLVRQFQEEDMPEAALEDQWEDLVAKLRLGEGGEAQEGRTERHPHKPHQKKKKGEKQPTAVTSTTKIRKSDVAIPPEESDGEEEETMMPPWHEDGKWGITYASAIETHGAKHLRDVLNRESQDLVARAEAMRQLVNKEAELAAQEREDRLAAKAERRERWLRERQEQQQQRQEKQGERTRMEQDCMF